MLVEMLTGLMPWCSERELSQPSVMLLVSTGCMITEEHGCYNIDYLGWKLSKK